MLNYELMTPYGETLNRLEPLREYPRPQLVRKSYLNLNGPWSFALGKTGDIPERFEEKILVPFSPESCLSGVHSRPAPGEYLIYSRSFELPEGFLQDKTLLHIGAADCHCRVILNGVCLGEHSGGYLPADFDLTAAIKAGQNELYIIVRDDTDPDYPIGKQRKKRGGIWYTPISGIWQTVWLESVPEDYVESLSITPDLSRNSVKIEIISASAAEAHIAAFAEGQSVFEGETQGHTAEIVLPEPRLWSPDAPFLYDLDISLGEDRVGSYFAMRSFEARDGRFFLNGRPYFVNGLLDQGYFSDGIYTPASYEAFSDDIIRMKALGFNTLRKHIKIEPMMFYHLCDRLGMLVFQDMVNTGKYSFFKDSVLPFAGFRRKRPWVAAGDRQKDSFIEAAEQTVRLLYSCPSVVYYTIFNEGWGQFDGDGLYTRLKALDPTRVYDATSGWFREKLSDVTSLHIYFKPIRLKKSRRPIIVSEFGGYSLGLPGHIFNDKKTFGYRKYEDMEAFENDFVKLYEREILGNLKNGLAGAVYTQISDVEDEVNGILSYDRRVCKLRADRVAPLMERICAQGCEQ